MPMDQENVPQSKERTVLGPAAWWLYSTLLVSMAVIPFTVGAFYITRFPSDMMELRIEYGVLMGLGLGAVLSMVVGFVLSKMARKNVE